MITKQFPDKFSRCIRSFPLFLIFSIYSSGIYSQNLVMNGSFEAPNNQVLYGTYLMDSGYISLIQGINFRDKDANLYQQKLGSKSAGCFTWRNDKYFKPSVLALNFRQQLQKDKWYEVSYFIKHGYGTYATNCNGISFSTAGKLLRNFRIPFKTLSTVNRVTGKQIINNQEWEQHTYLYKANGGENIILIGHVFYNDTVKFEELKNPKERYKGNMTLYMFDGVKVIPFENKLFTLFELESSELTFKEKITLDDLSNYLYTINYNNISLIGYADKTGKAEKNANLSYDRANAVRNYLLEKSIIPSKVQVKAMGSTDQFDKENIGLNRRVEIIIE